MYLPCVSDGRNAHKGHTQESLGPSRFGFRGRRSRGPYRGERPGRKVRSGEFVPGPVWILKKRRGRIGLSSGPAVELPSASRLGFVILKLEPAGMQCLCRGSRGGDPWKPHLGSMLQAGKARRDRSVRAFSPYGFYLAMSTARVSRITTTLIWPGYSIDVSIFFTMSLASFEHMTSSTSPGRTITRISRPAWIA